MSHRLSYEDLFYHVLTRGQFVGNIKGFPKICGSWCKELKTQYVDIPRHLLLAQSEKCGDATERDIWFSDAPRELVQFDVESKPLKKRRGVARGTNIVQYIGIAADETERIKRHIDRKDVVLPLVQIGWDEALCGLEATYMGMLSPTYSGASRDGCWFCHNQGVEQLRNLRKNYPDLWAILMQWDTDSPVTFHADGRTVHDFDRRFALEDEGLIKVGGKFRWADVDYPQEIMEGFK